MRFENTVVQNTTKPAELKLPFLIALDSSAISFTCFIACAKTFSTNTKFSFYAKLTAQSVRL